MVFLSIPYGQFDGSHFQAVNCGPAVTSELISLSSVDTLLIKAPAIRKASGDLSGGVEGGALAKAANTLTGYLYPIVYSHMADWRSVKDVIRHRPVAFVIDCSVTVKTPQRTNNFTGTHWVTARMRNDGSLVVEDPGTTYAGWKDWPWDLMKRASDFGGNHFFLQGMATEDVQRHATRHVAVRDEPDRNSKRLGGLAKGDEVHVRRTTKGGAWLRADGSEAPSS